MLEKTTARAAEQKPSVSLIIPTLNEGKNLPLVLPYIPLDVVDEVILVDGRSQDNTISVAKHLLPSIRVVYETKKGKGAALRCGYEKATGDILVVLDADGSNDPREIPRYVNALLEGADFVKGSRFAPTGGTTDMPRLRKLGNWGFVKTVNLLFSQTFSDLAYGFHAFWRHCLDYLELDRVDGFEVDAAIYLQAVRKKLRVVEVPSFEGYRFYGEGKLKTFPDGFRILRTILREWQAAYQTPAREPQVGFRSYGHVAGIYDGRSIPVSGENGDGREAGADSATASEIKCSGLAEFFQNRLPNGALANQHRVMSKALLTVMEDQGASSGSLLLLDEEGRISGGYRVFGRNVDSVSRDDIEDTLLKGFFGWAVKTKQAALVESTRSDPRWRQQPWEEEEGISRAAMVVPFVINGRVACVLTLARPDDRPFTEYDLRHL